MKKVVLVAFNGETMCFAHVLLNAMDMYKNGMDVKVVIEGAIPSIKSTYNKSELLTLPAASFAQAYTVFSPNPGDRE